MSTHYLLLVPDGVAIRNFLCTRFVDRLLGDGGRVTLWHALPDASLAQHRDRWPQERVTWLPLPAYREGLAERVLRQAKVDAQLAWQAEDDAADVQRRLRRPSKHLPTRLVAAAAGLTGRAFGSAAGVQRLDRWHARTALARQAFGDYARTIATLAPDVVFCTHQRASRAVPAMLAAQSAGVPTATFVYSWDNLPKGRMAVHADHVLVWSTHMRDELRRYYPELPDDRVTVVGTPQFEHYFDPTLRQDRATFFTEHGLDPARPVVCFSGDDVTTSPYDPQYLRDTAQALRALGEGGDRPQPQLLFRRCPVDASDRYDPVLADFPEIVTSDPRWLTVEGDWTQLVPTMADTALLVNVVAHCDCVVNLGSTMAMDFAILDKPAVYLAYTPAHTDPALGWRVDDIYRLPHFRTVHALEPVGWARHREDLADAVATALDHPERGRDARRAWLARIGGTPLDGASDRCFEALKRIAA